MNDTVKANPFCCPENFFMVKHGAPALQDGVLDIHLRRIECLLETARREFDEDQKLFGAALLETAQTLVDQVIALVRHDEITRRQARKPQVEGE